MPLFKFKNGKKDKKVATPPKKAASMNNIYNDYSGVYQGDKIVEPEVHNYRGNYFYDKNFIISIYRMSQQVLDEKF